jgi:hypothetical protein
MSHRTYFVTIDSRDRDRNVWSTSSQFEVKFDPVEGYKGAGVQRSFRNVVSIELVDVIHPHVEGYSHFYLRIKEIDGKILSTYNGSKYFAKIVPRTIVGGFVYSNNDFADTNMVSFFVRGTRIDKLTFEILKPNGEIADFGVDTGAALDPNPAVQTSFTLKIVTESMQRY